MNKFLNIFRTPDGKNHLFTFLLVSTLFFVWGFCNGLLDILNKHFQDALHISKAHSAFIQFANFIGYFVMAIPAGFLARRFGYKGGIIIGLGLLAAGSFWFMPATYINTYGAFLIGLFTLALGLGCLETIANPYTTVLGSPDMSATRINLAQSCNAVGAASGPWIGGWIVFSNGHAEGQGSNTLYIPYLGIAIVATILILIFSRVQLPDLRAEEEVVSDPKHPDGGAKPLWKRWHFLVGVVAQFLYVGAQVGINSFFINYMVSETPVLRSGVVEHWPLFLQKLFSRRRHLPRHHAGNFDASFLRPDALFAGAAFRKQSSALHRRSQDPGFLRPGQHRADGADGFSIGLDLRGGPFPLLFFMSIMFPTIFALAIRGLGDHTKLASSVIVMSIIGGALLPMFMGWLADQFSMRIGFLMPLGCFAFIFLYAASWTWLEKSDAKPPVTA